MQWQTNSAPRPEERVRPINEKEVRRRAFWQKNSRRIILALSLIHISEPTRP